MEKYARQAVSEGVKNADDLRVGGDSEIYRVLNLHYNRNNHIEVNWRSWRYVDWTFTLAWISRVTNFSEIIISRKIVSNATPFISSQYLNTSRRNEESDPDHQPLARPHDSPIKFPGSESSCQSRNFDGSEKIGRESETGRATGAIIRRSAMTAPPLPRLSHPVETLLNEFEFGLCPYPWSGACCKSLVRLLLSLLWGAIYFRHGVTTVDCICNAAAAAAAAGDGCAHVKQLFNII